MPSSLSATSQREKNLALQNALLSAEVRMLQGKLDAATAQLSHGSIAAAKSAADASRARNQNLALSEDKRNLADLNVKQAADHAQEHATDALITQQGVANDIKISTDNQQLLTLFAKTFAQWKSDLLFTLLACFSGEMVLILAGFLLTVRVFGRRFSA